MSDSQLTAGASAFMMVSCATISFDVFEKSWSTLAPGSRPATTPLIEPAPSACSAEVTSAPFSLSVARESSALDGAPNRIVTEAPVTIPVRTLSGVEIEYAGSARALVSAAPASRTSAAAFKE